VAYQLCSPGGVEAGYSPAAIEVELENRIVVAEEELDSEKTLECSAGFL